MPVGGRPTTAPAGRSVTTGIGWAGLFDLLDVVRARGSSAKAELGPRARFPNLRLLNVAVESGRGETLDGLGHDLVAALPSTNGPPDGPDVTDLRDSVPHLVVTSGCDCGCPPGLS
jgi:hypothetical protein